MRPKISSLGTALTPAIHTGSAQLLKIASQVCSIWKLLSNERQQFRTLPFSPTVFHRSKTDTWLSLFYPQKQKFHTKIVCKESERSKIKMMKNNPLLLCDLASYLNCLLSGCSESKLWDKGSQCYVIKCRGILLKPFKLSKWKVVPIALVYFFSWCQFSRWLCPLLKSSSR